MSDTVFVTMYAPALGNAQVDAPLQAVSTYQAHGWLLLDPQATPPPVASPFLTQPAADSRYLRDWAGAEQLTGGAVRVAPDGHVIVRTADGTTRGSYDATEQALWTAIGGQTAAQLAADPALRAALVAVATIRNDFSSKADGAPGALDSGQTPSLVGSTMVVSGGLLTDTASASGQSGSYYQVDAGATVTRLGADFQWASATNPGTVALVVWDTPIGADADVPAASCHFTITPTQWSYGIWPSKGAGSQVVLGYGGFATPLAPGTRYSTEVVIDGDTASVLLPDGSTAVVTDSRIASLAGRYACWETYYNDASTQTKPGFRRVWASPEPAAAYTGAAARRIARAGQLIRLRATYITATGESRAATTTFPAPELDTGLRLSIAVPPSGSLRQTMTAFVYGSGTYIWAADAYVDGVQVSTQETIVAAGTYADGFWVNLPVIWQGLTPGQLVEFRWGHRALAAGPNIYLETSTGRRATVTLEPLAA